MRQEQKQQQQQKYYYNTIIDHEKSNTFHTKQLA